MTLFVCVFPFSLSSACGAVFELVNLALNRTLPYHNITRSVGPFGRSDEAALAAKLAARSLGFSSAFCRLESSQCIVEDLLGSDSSYVNKHFTVQLNTFHHADWCLSFYRRFSFRTNRQLSKPVPKLTPEFYTGTERVHQAISRHIKQQ